MPAVTTIDVSGPIMHAVGRLSRAVDGLAFAPPVTHVYNPLGYARPAVRQYVERWARHGVGALLLGMNPGPWGMAQTGVPFGEVASARDFLGIDAKIGRPKDEHPKREVQGLACSRSEVSGRRVWGWAHERFGSADAFFARFFVWNYCPLAFMEESGRNRTPDKLPASERDALYEPCDRALRAVVKAIEPQRIIGIGAFATKRAEVVLAEMDMPIGTVLHPSPASPAANRGWAPQAEAQLREQGIELPGR